VADGGKKPAGPRIGAQLEVHRKRGRIRHRIAKTVQKSLKKCKNRSETTLNSENPLNKCTDFRIFRHMQPLFYSTGQVARELGTTQAAVRVLCETGAMASETTIGGHLRIPESEVKRFKRDGVPAIPRPLPTEGTASPKNGRHSDSSAEVSEVASAADSVAIARSLLERRRIERETEENEDWFREREQQRFAGGSRGASTDRGGKSQRSTPTVAAALDAIRSEFRGFNRPQRS
jgi:excisionase family DNA binding protein